MNPIKSIEQIRQHQTAVRDKRRGFITNFYLDEFKHSIWIQKGVLFSVIINDTDFFIKKSGHFWNVFYSATSMEDLSQDLEKFSSQYKAQELIFDIVGRDNQYTPILQLFKGHNFKCIASLVRMSKMTASMEFEVLENVGKATEDDIRVVDELLHKYFNDKTEQIPFEEELKEYYNRGHILVSKNNNMISGFVVYEINTTTQYLRYWFTHPDYREKKVGSSLLRKFFSEGRDTKRQMFWVIRGNENAIKRYKHFGFVEENMYDCVMSNK